MAVLAGPITGAEKGDGRGETTAASPECLKRVWPLQERREVTTPIR
jgi:hypothetical protein